MRTESLLNRAIFKNVLVAYDRGWYVVVHLYSNFSIGRQMAPTQSIKVQNANFPIFCTRIIVIFRTTCIAREEFSLVIMGNVTPILPVLHWLEVAIAFVSIVCIVFARKQFVWTVIHNLLNYSRICDEKSSHVGEITVMLSALLLITVRMFQFSCKLPNFRCGWLTFFSETTFQ